MERLKNKRVLVTAAARGIGRACALAAAREGAVVVATDIDFKALEDLSDARIRCVSLDGCDPSAVHQLLASEDTFDAVIHCIGYVHQGTILDCDLATWRQSFNINVDSLFLVLKAVLPQMRAVRHGSIVCISSVASSLKGLPRRAAYGASKAATIGLIKSVAADFVAEGIRCNAVCPGTISSPSLNDRVAVLGEEVGGAERALEMFIARQPMGRLGTPAEVAAMCIYLASDESCFVTGQAIAIDGGITI